MNTSKTERILNFIYRHRYSLSIIIILVIAALLRYSGYNWDGLYNIHPDERAIGEAVGKIGEKIRDSKNVGLIGSLDPSFYAYGSLPIYLAKLLSGTVSIFIPEWDTYDYYILSGRLISATASLASVFIVFLIGNKLYNKTTGIFASLFLALTVSHIQDGHFATVDMLLSFFIILTIYLLIDIYQGTAKNKKYFLVSAVIGLALAVKVSALPLVMVFFISHLIALYRKKELFKVKSWLNTFLLFSGCGLTILLINFIAQPFAYIHFSEYIERIQSELRIAKTADICYDWQYLNTPFLLYYIKELIFRSMGPPLGLLSIISFIVAIVYSLIKPSKSKHILLLIWALPYFITINTYQVKYIRYMEPLFPFFCLFTGYYFTEIIRYLWTTKTKKLFARIFSTIIIGYTLFYALAFVNIYMKPHTYIQASKWFYKNVPEESILLTTHWDEGFPLHIKENTPDKYKIKELKLYENRGNEINKDKTSHIASNLEKSDYFVAQSKRLYGTILNISYDFPISSRFYDLLFTERLGYKLVKEFTSYPSLFGIEINDDLSDESFSVYDHPKVLIFKKVKSLSKEEYKDLLTKKEPLSIDKEKAFLKRNKENISIKNYTIVEEILIVLFWILIIELFSFIGFAIGHKILKKAGISLLFFSHIIGILSFSYIIWILSSLKFIGYSFIFIFVIFILSLSLSFTYVSNNIIEIKRSFKENIDTLTLSKITFIGTFIIFIILRSFSPEIYWGEKPMDFGIFNNLISISTLPPNEIWYSGNSLSYYYFGHFIYATITKLTFIPSFFTYNLALATNAALLFNASFGILLLLTKKYRYGFIAGIITVFFGNLSGLRELIYGKNPVDFEFFWATSRVIPNTVNEYPFWSALFGDLHAHVLVAPIFMFLLYIGINIYNNYLKEEKISLSLLATGAFIAGTIAISNIWDMPTAIMILFTTITVCLLDKIVSLFKFTGFKNLITKSIVIIKTYSLLLISLIVSYLAYLPFWLQIKRSSDFNFGFFKINETINIIDFTAVWGFFLFIIATFISIELYKFFKKAQRKESNQIVYLLFAIIAGLIIIAIPFHSYIIENRTLLLNFFLLILSIIILFKTNKKEHKIICGYLSLGLTILFCTGGFFIYDRMNTIFKYYLQTWYLFSISCSYIIYYLFNNVLNGFVNYKNKKYILVKRLWIVPFIVLIVLSIITTVTAGYGFTKNNRTITYKPIKTINGLKYLQYKNISDYMAIEWINKNLKQPVIILEAQNKKDSAYGDYARIVMNTGRPTVTGWEHHLTQRGIKRDELKNRYKDVKTIYQSKKPDKAYYLLKKYNVDYVYRGSLEVKTYGFFNVFEKDKNLFKKVYSNDKVRIYKVL